MGVTHLRLTPHVDARGSFTEVFNEDWGLGFLPVEWSIVRSGPGVLRGMHLHRRHDEVFQVVTGLATVGLHDARPGSATEGMSATYLLDGDEPSLLAFPPGLVHGWLFHRPTVHLQGVTESHRTYGPDDNNGCHWSDPALGIDWPFAPTSVAPRAEAFGSLAELLRTAPA
ncbi:dTDP-4-dehydrorhamnose 3,5-epimerase family protein [Iamia majanohamensis]|uniref:dTDP-4-dehydrorhamnose 3,5-epimerase family protein n=1 Tax=Iamia majanohamensis TaxID=467976 RepID=A0AAE9Y8F8_9ACTN|nr:dTDP-4-dehydrorhamnose 3,5-epimerase family protein [Iamia majanohamensis]WCO68670.1 dTDP-4-dehydrorhamnose 3,5-epimerase family protein [Iamia majanohamensis]